MTQAKQDYSIGSVVEYKAFGGDLRTVTISAKEPDIKNGRPGFCGDMYVREGAVYPEYQQVWGYDSQIVRVIR